MKTLLNLLLCLLLHLSAFAQLTVSYEACTNCNPDDDDNVTYQYGAAQQFQTNHISSDFGRRNAGSDWHGGVDYTVLQGNADRGYHLLAIEGGDIVALRAGQGNYKYIVVEGGSNFGYAHIFRGDTGIDDYPMRSGDLVLWRGADPGNPGLFRYAILSTSLGEGWATWADDIVYENTTYAINDEIEQDDVIAQWATLQQITCIFICIIL